VMTASSKWRAALAATAASAVLAAAPLIGAQPAYAQYPPPAPELTLSSTEVEPGDELDFTGTGFAPNQDDVEAALASKIVVLGTFTANATGTVEGTVTIPEKTKPGEHLFLLRAEEPDLTLSAEITVLEGDNGGDHGDGHGGKPGHDQGGKPGHDHGGKPGHGHGGEPGYDHGGKPGYDHGGKPGYDHGGKPGYDHGGKPSHEPAVKPTHDPSGKPHLADTGEDRDRSSLVLGGAAGLLLLGGGAILLTQRRAKRD
jgi:LPXTG-motif cell wall-anchored protein